MKSKPKQTKSHWDELDELLGLTREPMGPEWFTVEQFARLKGYSIVSARRMLVKCEKIEVWNGKIAAIGRRGFKYRIKPKK
jgi:response regulator of citrate/malate metabolism